jgi:hypothetical protein
MYVRMNKNYVEICKQVVSLDAAWTLKKIRLNVLTCCLCIPKVSRNQHFFFTVAATNDMTSFFSAYKKHIAHGKKHRVQNSFLNKRTMRVIIPAGPPRRILGAQPGEAQRGRSAQSDWVPSGGEPSGWVDSAFLHQLTTVYLLLTIVQ